MRKYSEASRALAKELHDKAEANLLAAGYVWHTYSDGSTDLISPQRQDTLLRLEQSYMTSGGRIVSRGERVAAAQARVVADRGRGRSTPQWIVDLAEGREVTSAEDRARQAVEDYIQALIDERCPDKIGSAEDLADAAIQTIKESIG